MSALGKVEEGDHAAALFREIWVADFEFRADPGERPWPVCLVAEEAKSGQVIRLWRDELLALREAPFNVGPDNLFVAFFASAEFGCFLQWLRGLIRPPQAYGLAYVDFCSQEIAIAAALSADERMAEGYLLLAAGLLPHQRVYVGPMPPMPLL
jgi:hypothetical protein